MCACGSVWPSFVLLLGWLQGWYGRTAPGDVYGSDAVQYLDIARAFERGDWHTALNPLWSQGYPVSPIRGDSGDHKRQAVR